jgi:hypothetical protein
VTDRYGHATDTFTQNNDYYIHGCNFGDSGEATLVFPALSWEPAETHPLLWNGEFPGRSADQLKTMLPDFGGRIDQDGITLRVVRSDGAFAELHNQKFRALRRNMIITWIPSTRLLLGTAYYQNQTFPTTVTMQGNQNNSYYNWDSSELPVGPPPVMIRRSGNNIGGPFAIAFDEINLSRMPAGFTIVKVEPYFLPSESCGEKTGGASMHWAAQNLLKVGVNVCFTFTPNAQTGDALSQYGFTVLVNGPQGVSPWAATQ